MCNNLTKILLVGACGHMGRVISDCVSKRDDCKVIAGVDPLFEQYADFPVYPSFNEVKENPDVIIDFSHPSALEGILEYSVNNNVPVVVATTGMDEKHIEMINKASDKVPVFFTYNMSLGVNLLAELAKKAALVLSNDFDIEIVEAHHNQKLDAPSGTAIMLADAINETLDNEYSYEYDRHSKRAKRPKKEIGMHAIRGGTIVGEHEIIFAGRDEIVKLSHSARSKEIFAVGSVNAAIYLKNQDKGIYNMSDLLSDK